MDRERTSGVSPTPSTRNSSINRGCATPVVSATLPVPKRRTATLAGLNDGDGVVDGVEVRVLAGVPVSAGLLVATGVCVPVDAAVDVTDAAGVTVSADVPVGVLVEVGRGVPVIDADKPTVCDGVTVEADEDEADELGDPVPVDVPVGTDDGVAVEVGVPEGDAVGEGVPVRALVGVAVPVVELVGVHDTHAAATVYGAAVTPRNTVLAVTTASTAEMSVAVLYEYSFVAEVAYSINTPHAPSCRPAREMIMVPLSSSIAAVGVCRAHTELTKVYCARLFTESVAVSVDHRLSTPANANPYGTADEGIVSAPVGNAEVGRLEKATNPADAPDDTAPPPGSTSAPALDPSVHHSLVAVATREPVHSLPYGADDLPTQPTPLGLAALHCCVAAVDPTTCVASAVPTVLLFPCTAHQMRDPSDTMVRSACEMEVLPAAVARPVVDVDVDTAALA